MWHHGADGAPVQASPQSPTPAAVSALPMGGGEEAAVRATETGASPSQIDLDELMDKVWQQLMHKLTIEQERRGYTRW
jgi:hypothetical protein